MYSTLLPWISFSIGSEKLLVTTTSHYSHVRLYVLSTDVVNKGTVHVVGCVGFFQRMALNVLLCCCLWLCTGPHVSRMGREDRQKLLYKQYFFTCQCTACKR